jgi:NodT family efflux transporter outer membrane factor (OMF) lipoprotein
VASLADVAQAQTQIQSAQAQAINVGVQRAQLEHAIAVLVGKPPAEFRIPVGKLPTSIPTIPREVPSALLERRPDIAAAERTMASASAQIGVAISGFFPSLSLNDSYGFSSSVLKNLFQASNSIWFFGPQLAWTLFDGGVISSQVAQARATYDQNIATYRQTVLTAFQQVEDQLAALRILAGQAKFTKKAVASAQTAERILLNHYKRGIVDYTSVVTTQIATLTAQQTDLTVHQNRLTAVVSLVQALGGGWHTSRLPEALR